MKQDRIHRTVKPNWGQHLGKLMVTSPNTWPTMKKALACMVACTLFSGVAMAASTTKSTTQWVIPEKKKTVTLGSPNQAKEVVTTKKATTAIKKAPTTSAVAEKIKSQLPVRKRGTTTKATTALKASPMKASTVIKASSSKTATAAKLTKANVNKVATSSSKWTKKEATSKIVPVAKQVNHKLATKVESTKIERARAEAAEVHREPVSSGGEPIIRVLLGNPREPLTIKNSEGLMLLDSANKDMKYNKLSNVMTFKNDGGHVSVDGKNLGKSIFVQSQEGRYLSVLDTLGRSYRGAMQVTATSSGALQVVNYVPLEQYLYGVVPEEAVPSWRPSALEAQAVAARTYALYTMNTNKGRAYDVEPTTYHQVYKGKSSEYASTTAAVRATRGMVITYQNQPINALFHSDGGGFTENSENVWGSSVPYLRGVVDYSNNTGTTSWKRNLTEADLEHALAAAGKGVGTLKSLELTPLKRGGPMKVLDRGVSGRVKSMTFTGSNGRSTISGEDFMGILGLQSTLFDINDGRDNGPKRTFSGGSNPLVIHGYGWGHGLGLSQWGAAEMAEKAPASDKNYYKTILKHYYYGVDITPWYK